MTSPALPEHFQPASAEQELVFACYPGVSCFTQCCRELDLALTPYDVLRLKRRLALSSGQFLDRYVIVEWDEGCILPTCYLTMVDDGRASCVFVGDQGCAVYDDRPGSCRAYPVGRGAARGGDGMAVESLVLLHEPHCRGFAEATGGQTVCVYLRSQGLESYNRFNDALLPLVQHPAIQAGAFRPSRQQLDQYILALYDLDQFRGEMASGRVSLQGPLNPVEMAGLTSDDEQLLLLGLRWLRQEWFGE
ncbi:YkgJ family cysteine cluster protein [Desulfobulbus sp.]|uniref:YkgJ family cysteine cluster protein n=1 Tax=Desulfobulbus sp. TaxID=895 RepID=UPI00286ED27F|nr:YkgJ family cysteine cluster protein [Desulfobulbus sp.]